MPVRSVRALAGAAALLALAAVPAAAQMKHATAVDAKPNQQPPCSPDKGDTCSISGGANMTPGESNSPASGWSGGGGGGDEGGSGGDDKGCGAGLNPVQRRIACQKDTDTGGIPAKPTPAKPTPGKPGKPIDDEPIVRHGAKLLPGQ